MTWKLNYWDIGVTIDCGACDAEFVWKAGVNIKNGTVDPAREPDVMSDEIRCPSCNARHTMILDLAVRRITLEARLTSEDW
jgi:hypothetical protein